jgi:hypothetical protein
LYSSKIKKKENDQIRPHIRELMSDEIHAAFQEGEQLGISKGEKNGILQGRENRIYQR